MCSSFDVNTPAEQLLTTQNDSRAVMAHQNKIKKKKKKEEMRQIHMITDSLSLPNHQTPNTCLPKKERKKKNSVKF